MAKFRYPTGISFSDSNSSMAFSGDVIRTPPKSKITARTRLVLVREQAMSPFFAEEEEGELGDIISFKSLNLGQGPPLRSHGSDRQMRRGGMKLY
jgi:hypothetical protein